MYSSHNDDNVTFVRDCEVIQIPSGERETVPAGTKALITQSLGGTYTVVTNQGWMVRIAASDADAIGRERTVDPAENAPPPESAEEVEKLVWDQLRTVFDPEIPVNIADLGLVYKCEVEPVDDAYKVGIEMTLTAPGCGMGDVLKAEVEDKLKVTPGVKELDVELVFDPPWDMSMMPEAAKLALGLM
jgi:probable FeS assembly SUF system protein SufT